MSWKRRYVICASGPDNRLGYILYSDMAEDQSIDAIVPETVVPRGIGGTAMKLAA